MYDRNLFLAQVGRWIASHGFAYNIDAVHGCVQVVIPCTRNGVPVLPLIKTVDCWTDARRALGY